MTPLRLEVCSLGCRLGSTPVLRDVALEVPAGSFAGLIGPSGSGKTTLLRLIAGLEGAEPGGSVRIGTVTVTGPGVHLPPEERRLGMVFQDLGLWPHLSAAGHLEAVAPGTLRERRRKAVEWLERVGLSHRSLARPRELSGGEKQRLALARALVPGPGLLLLDEPFKSLDEPTAHELARWLRELAGREGFTVLLVSHSRAEALRLCDPVACLVGGRIVAAGSPRSLVTSDAPPEVRRFLDGWDAG